MKFAGEMREENPMKRHMERKKFVIGIPSMISAVTIDITSLKASK